MGAVLAAQQSLRKHTRRLDTCCIQLTVRSQSVSPHAQKSHTHDPALTDLHPEGLSCTSQCECMTDLHRLKHCQLFIPGLTPVAPRDAPRRSPTAQEAQRKDDKLSIRPSSGEFSSCLHILCETPLSRSTCAEQSSSHLAQPLSWTYISCSFPSPPCLSYMLLFRKL